MFHQLSVFPGARPVAQKRRRMSLDRAFAVQEQVQNLLDAGFIREIIYLTWLFNVVMVKKQSGKWQMCVDYFDLNKAYPYLLPSIDGLVDAASGFQFLTFMDAYSEYNQISMHPLDVHNTYG